jgi:hypothetical protein
MPQFHSIPTFIFQQDEVPPTSTVMFDTTWTECYQDVGQGVRLEMTNPWCYGPRGPLILRPVIFFFRDMSKTGYSSLYCQVTSLT